MNVVMLRCRRGADIRKLQKWSMGVVAHRRHHHDGCCDPSDKKMCRESLCVGKVNPAQKSKQCQIHHMFAN